MNRIDVARRLSRGSTEAEQKLWSRLRNRQLHRLKFRRQRPIEGYVADFACVEARIVIEVDGGQHATRQEHDQARSDAIDGAGFIVIRFWNDQALREVDAVLEEIERIIALRSDGL